MKEPFIHFIYFMSNILQNIFAHAINFILYLYIGLANQHEEYGKGGIQNNLEMYRNLKCTQYTSPVQKILKRL